MTSPGVVTGLVAFFERLWESGTPLGETPRGETPLGAAHGLSPQERELLRLLAAGNTDESAASRLAVSVRSVQRMTTVLTEKLKAESRFQAGVEAKRRGRV